MTFISYAQNFEDVLLWRALGAVQAGFYIDVGASHPDTDSVTRAFYDRGWSGINVEPTAASYQRLVAARPRDLTLRLALGTEAGTATFFSVDDANTGLSTLDPAAAGRYGTLGMTVQRETVQTETLAAICLAHAPGEIHFLKIDVEGAEKDVLAGADFAAFRPWIIVVEATAPMSTEETHGEWEPILLDAGYRCVWFDGLNRFYVPEERHAQLAPSFRTPPNVFDNFLRAADTEWTRRIAEAESRAEALQRRARAAELRGAVAEDRAEVANLRLARANIEAIRLRNDGDAKAARLAALEQEAARATAEWAHAVAVADVAEHARIAAESWLSAIRGSTSWRLTEPLRRITALRGGGMAMPGDAPAPSAAPAPAAPPAEPAAPRPAPPAGPVRAVHQFHSGTGYGDAITNAMLLTRGILRGLGYDSRIFAEHRDERLGDEIHGLDALPRHADYALIVRHSMGHDALDRILALPVRKVLLYHNITPPELLEGAPYMQRYARIGREQLATLRPAVAATLADSDYNAMELRGLGFDPVAACTLLFDLDAMPPPTPRLADGLFTVLFVGRVTGSKGQVALVDAFARFREQYDGATQLVLVGRHEDPAYLGALLALVRRRGLDTGAVDIAGLVDESELQRCYARADLYVSLSQHEGFGVPLVEAVAHGIPVLAVGAGAVPYTLGDPRGLLPDASPAAAADRMLELAQDPAARAALADDQASHIARFGIRHQLPALLDALAAAGVARPAAPATRAALAAHACFTVAGHVNGTYSLAEINRQLALALERERPGSTRLLPVEGDVTTDTDRIPPGQHAAISALLARPAPDTGPHVVISQHYPVWAPPAGGPSMATDMPLALFFWEESLVPPATIEALSRAFRGVLAPAASVAKALVDSGLRIPVRIVGHAPALEAFSALRAERQRTPRHGPFTFLHVSSCFPRKGVDVLVAAYARAFSATDAVRLVIKGFPNPHNTVAADLAALRAAHPGLATVELIDEDITAEALLALYRAADAVVLPSRGEGYNLPAAEAIAAGIPVITTGWGGHMDFTADAPSGAVRLLDYRFAPAATHLSTPFSVWAEPVEDDLVAALQEAMARGRVDPPAPMVPGSLAMADRIAGFAADLLLAPAPPPPRPTAWITTWDVRCGVAEYARTLIGAMPGPATIFADFRTAAPESPSDGLEVMPSWWLADPSSFAGLMNAVLQQDPRAIVIQQQPGLIPWAHLPALLLHPALHGRVVCVALHNTRDLSDSPAPIRAAAVAALARMSRVVVHTVHDLNTLAALGLAETATLIPQGAVRPATAAAAPKALAPEQPVLIGCYGFFLPDKGIPQLIEAVAILRRRWPKARLRLVNAEYPLPQSQAEIAQCRALAAKLGLDEAVAFETGFLDPADSAALLAACDLVALPYNRSRESSSAALRSAMAAGPPVAVTPLPLFDEAAGAVLRLPGTTPAMIAEGIDAALRDSQARAAVQSAAKAWLESHDWAVIARRWSAMLDALSASGLVVR